MTINYNLDDEQKNLLDMVRQFVQKELSWETVHHYDTIGELPMDIYKKAAEIGLTALSVPKEYGGPGISYFTSSLLMEELGKGDAGFAVSVGANSLGLTPVLLGGTEEQKQKISDCILEGGTIAFALTEDGAGSDAAACRTTAVRDGDEYILNGSKAFITNGGIADIYIVFASTDPSKGARGISAFIVERNRPGISAGKEEDKMGIRLSNTTEVILDDVHIPAENLVGKEGYGYKLAMETLDRTRPSGSAAALGICQSAIEQCIAYGRERKTFGRPIISNQGLQFMLADMEIQTQAARTLTLQAASRIDDGIVDASFGAVTKTFVSDTAVRVALDAIQIFGGYGYTREYPVEILVRNAKIFQIFEGTNQIQRMVIAGSLIGRL